MPPRRVFRRKQRTAPLTEFVWKFFLSQSVADFDRLAADPDNSSAFFFLYYDDRWKEVYAAHRAEIEAEWRRRRWTRKQKQFVMTDYNHRHINLEHDVRRERELKLWQEWSAREGWRTETWAQYLSRLERKRS